MDIQETVIAFWNTHNIYQLLIEQNKRLPKISIYDGPPFPTGPPHHGHMMTSAVKDTIIRYLMSTGHYVPRLLGWDMHGPNVNNKSEQYIKVWLDTLQQLGRWHDGEYRTSSPEYRESVWWVYKTLINKGHVKIEHGLSIYCPNCSLFFSDFEKYHLSQPIKEKSIYYRVRIINTDNYLLIWEMKPWTLSECCGYAINPSSRYVLVNNNIFSYDSGILTESNSDSDIVDFPTDHLLTLKAIDPLTGLSKDIVGSTSINPIKGSGIMNLSPNLNAQSFDIAKTLRLTCTFTECNISVEELSHNILDELTARDALYKIRYIDRNDSICSRCYGRTIIRPCYGGFYKVSDLKLQIENSIQSVYWEPKCSKEKMLNYLTNARDWYITRPYRPHSPHSQGIPVPLWFNDAGDCINIGSYGELNEYGATCQDGILSDFIYRDTTYRWSNWYFDNWLDSACMPYGSVQYPFRTTKMELEHTLFPCLLAVEGTDQIYGWFFSTIAISTSLFAKSAFQNIITNGLVLEDGNKMSKSRKHSNLYKMNNVSLTSVTDVIKQYGADNYRIYLMQNRLLSGIDFDYDESKITSHFTKNIQYIWNTLKPCTLTSNINIQFKPTRITNITDNWLLQTLDNYLEEYHGLMNKFKVSRALTAAIAFNTKMRKYIVFNKMRLQQNDTISASVLLRTFYYFLTTTAPFAPFISEYLYLELKPYMHGSSPSSIHLCQIPPSQWRMNKKFLMSSDLMFHIIDLVHKFTSRSSSKSRSDPLDLSKNIRTLTVYVPDVSLLRGVDGYIKEVTKCDVIYDSNLESVLNAEIIIHNHSLYTDGDRIHLSSLSMRDILLLDAVGYYRNIAGIKTYPGQYMITYTTTLDNAMAGKGIVVVGTPLSTNIDSKEIISNGQLIARKLKMFVQIQTKSKCIIYIDHAPLSQIIHTKCKVLLTNLNRYTLPIINQSIYHYRNQDTFAKLQITMYDTDLTFYLSGIEQEEGV
jgi:isoleucyl-tRNA synthetase